ncbi:MAG: DUF2764 family protein [Clostridia bacterium]|nr:DUF2764 family protein [Clostridia bacterium]
MSEYYLISQLPSLDGISENMPLPITEERFFELCNELSGKKIQNEISKITLLPSKVYEKSSSSLIENWNNGERNLRLALAKMRADKMKKSFDIENNVLLSELLKVANTAIEIESPMEAEKFLNSYRLEFLETLRPMDNFSEEFVYYYGLKLKLISHIRQFDTNAGEIAYRNIYNSIMNGDRLEAI